MIDWSEVRKGWVVSGAGKEWVVTEANPPIFTISHPSQTWTGERTGSVEVVSRPAPQQDPQVQKAVAEGLIAMKLSGITIGKQDRQGRWICPVEYDDPASLLTHLMIFHGSQTDEASLAGLRKIHGGLHGPHVKRESLYEPHVHDPDFDGK